MQKLINFVAGLLPNTSAVTINSEIDNFFEDMRKNIRPMFNIDDTVGFKSTIYITLDKYLKNNKASTGYKGNLIQYMQLSLDELIKNEVAFKDFFNGRFKNDVLKEAMDYEHAQLMQMIAGFAFFADYTRKLAVSLIRSEINNPYKPVDKMFVDFIMRVDNLDKLMIMLPVVRSKPSELATKLKPLEQISFSANNVDVVSSSLGVKQDPFRMGFLGTWGPFYLVGQLYNTYITWRYDLAKDTKAKQEQLVIMFEKQKNGASPEELAAIQKKIDYYNNNINKIMAYMQEIEEDAGITS